MPKNKDSICYANIMERIKNLDTTIQDFKQKIEQLKITTNESMDAPPEEVCLDEVESEKALLEILQDECLIRMLDKAKKTKDES